MTDGSSAAGNGTALLVFAGALLIYGNGLVLTGAPAAGLWGAPLPRIGLDLLFAHAGYRLALRPDLRGAAVRLLPGLFAAVAVTILLIGPVATTLSTRFYFLNGLTLRYGLNAALLPHYFLPGVFAGQQWSGAVNGMVWVLLPGAACAVLLRLLGARRRRVPIAVGLAVASAAVALLYPPFGPGLRQWIPGINVGDAATEIPFALFGAAYAWAGRRVAFRADGAMLLFAANWALATWVGQWDLLLEWPSLPYMAICFARGALPGLGRLHVFGRPGWGLVLYGFPIQQLVVAFAPGTEQPILATFLLALAAGLLSWHLVERPALAHAP